MNLSPEPDVDNHKSSKKIKDKNQLHENNVA